MSALFLLWSAASVPLSTVPDLMYAAGLPECTSRLCLTRTRGTKPTRSPCLSELAITFPWASHLWAGDVLEQDSLPNGRGCQYGGRRGTGAVWTWGGTGARRDGTGVHNGAVARWVRVCDTWGRTLGSEQIGANGGARQRGRQSMGRRERWEEGAAAAWRRDGTWGGPGRDGRRTVRGHNSGIHVHGVGAAGRRDGTGPGLSPKARPSPARASSSPAWPDIRLDRAQGSGLGNLRPAEARQARARLCIRQAESPALGKLSGAWLSLAECHLLPNRIFSDLLQDQASAPAGMTPRTGRPRLEPGLEAWAGLDAGSGSGSANVKPKPAKAQPKPGLLGPARP
ncbi:hypothetical protein FB45DRAFT_1012235 [Roridomyces roridus]|uniref:Uncharacterized protein n=1 Tax=Roridomyces roridus TaxID=1738132 RepID=A0AAD7B052_9AGAR|nr:hypothetical protein FB45DRAFT_1012235 [Roridomyces roridus]